MRRLWAEVVAGWVVVVVVAGRPLTHELLSLAQSVESGGRQCVISVTAEASFSTVAVSAWLLENGLRSLPSVVSGAESDVTVQAKVFCRLKVLCK